MSNLELTYTVLLCRKLIGLLALLKSRLNFWMHLALLRTLYTNLVCLHYACVVWCPFQLGDMRTIENVHRRVTEVVPSLKDNPYYDCLASLNLPSLLYRRSRMDTIMVYLIVRGLESISFDNLCTYCDLSTRSNGYKLYNNYCHLNTGKYTFSQRIINDCNYLHA